ncbi:MAG: hypothetical protein MRERC_2c028 [Mycoplasmataceae bacterium RC_NB112A]|nr:MAG: hypothetical protein MRERC_2c028 [Mycoplasmataceae bacterium RC_NB112A]
MNVKVREELNFHKLILSPRTKIAKVYDKLSKTI